MSSLTHSSFVTISRHDSEYQYANKYSRGSEVDVTSGINLQQEQSVISTESSYDIKGREIWTGRLDFLLSCIGFAVGLGNIWRFPYLCYKSGGGAFLIPYTFFLMTCGMPLFYMEVVYGQFASLSPISVWRISPLFRGIGYGMVIISAIVCIYYNVIIAWDFYFLYMSISWTLPWTQCDKEWNTKLCVLNRLKHNGSLEVGNLASLEFWERNVLEMSDGIENMGTIRKPLLVCLFIAWVIVFLCLYKGIKSSGKVVYVTATFPYIVLVILLIRGVTLPGAEEGIRFYVIPKWEKLLDLRVWGDAAVQIFYSVGMAWGSLITMSSYNKFDHNVFRDAIVVPLVNCGTSVFAGFVIFSTLGFMAHSRGVPIENVVSQGPGLTFVAYPEAVSKMPASQLWAILFFLMIFMVGVDSQFGMFETITSAFIDEFPQLLRRRKTSFTAIVCFVEFLLGIPLVMQGGIYLLQIVDWYSATFSLMLISVVECIVISWCYGVDRFGKDIMLMMGTPPSYGWKIMWKYITPLLVTFTWFFSIGTLEPVSINSYTFPRWAIYMGWAFGSMSLIPLPIEAFLLIRRERSGTLWQRIKKLAQPAHNWGPAFEDNRIRYIQSMNHFEKDRFEAAHFRLDRERYLSMRQLDDMGRIISLNLEGMVDMSTVDECTLSPEICQYFTQLKKVHNRIITDPKHVALLFHKSSSFAISERETQV